ncbi:MAG: hypothetical protein ABI586_05030 [Candidatus Nanopelagicales bacterium]
MRKIVLLTAGGAIGYVLGARAGHDRYESIRSQAATTVQNRVPTAVARIRKWRADDEFGVADLLALPEPTNGQKSGNSSSLSGPPFADLTTPVH